MEKLSMYHFPPAHSSFYKSRYWAWLGLIDYEALGKKLKPVLQQNSIQSGYTPLLLAIEQNRQQVVETLIQNKANIHAVDQKGRTALMFALEQKSKHIVEMLLQNGIDVCAADNFGQMALAYAIASGDSR
ncbi:putative ankyrin repeat domain-containing protein 19 [Marmota monax]|uniref:putative ankyrin repeat domain-containing protein 19 n=1 Tax=Marmota monax TaxID=9995 RepID=UPI0026F36DC4|nr:putative ankyrin repeat domain-containing protein 19 [Marmota monax]